jgi:hypothetical protein
MNRDEDEKQNLDAEEGMVEILYESRRALSSI